MDSQPPPQQLVKDYLAAEARQKRRGVGRPKGSRDSKPRKVPNRSGRRIEAAAEALTSIVSPALPTATTAMESSGSSIAQPAKDAPYCKEQLFDVLRSLVAYNIRESQDVKQLVDRALREDPRKADIFAKLEELRNEVNLLKAVDAKQDVEDKKLIEDVKFIKEELHSVKRKVVTEDIIDKRFASLDARLKSYESRFKATEDRLLSAELRLPS